MKPELGDAESFGAWLINQSGTPGWIGGLAKAAKADRQFPRGGSADDVRAHLSKSGADSDMFEAVDDAEGEWLRRDEN